MLAKMFERRCRGYEAIGYTIQLPASGMTHWPAEVALPVNPLWKQNYAASVRRLIRDGIDKPLAKLFYEATRAFPVEVEGADRARSVCEAFLCHRLNSLSWASGRFHLNVEFQIPFDGMGKWKLTCSIVTLE